MKTKFTFLLLIFLAFTSCGPSLDQHNRSEVEKAREHWVGKSKQTLITSWGPPTSKSSDENGGEIFTYRRNNGYIIWVTNFYINDLGYIYHLNAFSE